MGSPGMALVEALDVSTLGSEATPDTAPDAAPDGSGAADTIVCVTCWMGAPL